MFPKKGTKCSDNCHHIGTFANTKRMSGVVAYCVVSQLDISMVF